jgi:thiopurine S-methyltransferase
MDRDFWQTLWQSGDTKFHQNAVHSDLIAHRDRFLGPQRRRILVPLCGKTRDLAWLSRQDEGHEVVGAEFSPLAAEQMFGEAGLTPTVTDDGAAQRWESGDLTVFVGDFFELTDAQLGRFDRIWDRAALVALPPAMRERYATRLLELLEDDGAMLLNCFRYDLDRDGPPHSIPELEVFRHYGSAGRLELLGAVDALTPTSPWREAGATEFVVKTWWLQRGT